MTAAIHLVRNPLDPTERESYKVEAGTRVIDWLQEVAPEGFGMPIELYVNQQPLEVVDSDLPLQEGDICQCIVTPGFGPGAGAAAGAVGSAAAGGFLASVQSYAIYAAVSLAVSLGVGALFGPKRPKSQRGPNPVYDIGANENSERLGEPIPVVYGTVVTTPDFASVPYNFYSTAGDDNQFVDQLFCLGVGEFEEITADDIIIGETPSSNFPAGVVMFQQFHLGAAAGNILSHGGAIGNIQSQLWETGDFGVDEWSFLENVYTAPDVTQWEFREGEDQATGTTTYAVDITLTGEEAAGRKEIELRMPVDTGVVAGQVFDISGTAFDGTYQANRVLPDTSTASGTPPDIDYTHVFVYAWAPVGITPTAGAASIDVVRNIGESRARSPYYAAQPAGQTVRSIYLDFVAPGGLYKVKSNSGTRVYLPAPYAPTMTIEAEEIDPATGEIKNDTAAGTGFKLSRNIEFNSRLPDPLRRSWTLLTSNVVTIPAGLTADDWRDRAYVVRVTATHEFLDNDRYQQRVLWTGLRGNISHPSPADAYGDVTLLAVRMRATNGISQLAQNRLKVKCRRVYDLQDGSRGASGNPVDVAHDIYTGTGYGLARPASEIDTTMFSQARGLWDAQNVEFNGVFLQDVTLWEALETALVTAVAKPAIDGGMLTIVADKKKPVTMFLFNDMSIVRDSYIGAFTIDNTDETDGIEVEYRDPQSFDPAYVRIPSSAVKPDRLVYVGVTDETYATQLAQLFWNRREHQRHTATWETEMQGMVPLVGDKMSVSTPVLQSGVSGRVVGINDTVVTLDRRIQWTGNAQISFTRPDMSPTAYYDITEGSEPNIAVLATPVVEDLDMSLTRTPTSYHIRMDGYAPRDMLVAGVEHSGGTQFKITGISYPEDVGGVNPLFDGGPPHLVLDWDGSPL